MKELSLIKNILDIKDLNSIINFISDNHSDLKKDLSSLNSTIKIGNKIFSVSAFSVNIDKSLYVNLKNEKISINIEIGGIIDYTDKRTINLNIKNLANSENRKLYDFEEIVYRRNYNYNNLRIKFFNHEIKENKLLYGSTINVELNSLQEKNDKKEITLKIDSIITNAQFDPQNNNIEYKTLFNYINKIIDKNQAKILPEILNKENIEFFEKRAKRELGSLLNEIDKNILYKDFLKHTFEKETLDELFKVNNYIKSGTDFINILTPNIYYKRKESSISLKHSGTTLLNHYQLYVKDKKNIFHELKKDQIILNNSMEMKTIPLSIESINFKPDMPIEYIIIPRKEFKIDISSYSFKNTLEDFAKASINDFSICHYLDLIFSKINLKTLDIEDIFNKDSEDKLDMIQLETDIHVKQKIYKALRDIEDEFKIKKVLELDNNTMKNSKKC